MINKICLAAAVAIAGMMFGTQSEANADYCYRGGPRGVSVRGYSPYAAYRYAAPRPVYTSPYRSGFGYGYGYGVPAYRAYRPGFYGSPYGPPIYGRGTSIGIGRGGVSIGFGF